MDKWTDDTEVVSHSFSQHSPVTDTSMSEDGDTDPPYQWDTCHSESTDTELTVAADRHVIYDCNMSANVKPCKHCNWFDTGTNELDREVQWH